MIFEYKLISKNGKEEVFTVSCDLSGKLSRDDEGRVIVDDFFMENFKSNGIPISRKQLEEDFYESEIRFFEESAYFYLRDELWDESKAYGDL